MIDVITCRGTGEAINGPNNMLNFVVNKLDKKLFNYLGDCRYPASIGAANQFGTISGVSENQSIEIGKELLAQAIRASDNPVGLLGYSLGAELVSRFLEAKARGEYADCELAFAGLMANPSRRENDSMDLARFGYGINGEHAAWPDIPTFEAANPQDGITSCPRGSVLRKLADHISAFTFAGTSWSADLADRLRRQRWQPVHKDWFRNPVGTWRNYENAGLLIRGYLYDQQHTNRYVTDGYTARLALKINQQFS